MSEPYEGMGEFHDLFVLGAWDRLQPQLAATFGGLTPRDVVLDIGAGTGVGTRMLSRCTPAQILAVEPSRTMRSVLLARVADDEVMSRRVSVLAHRVPDALADVPDPIGGFVCAHMLGHLDAGARTETFLRLGAMLSPHGTGFITVAPGSSSGTEQEVLQEERSLGRHRYVARYSSSPDGESTVTDYLVLDRDRVVRRETFPARWTPPSEETLREELAQAGLEMAPAGDGVALVRRHGDER